MVSRSISTRERKEQRSSGRARAAVVLCLLAVLCAPSAASATSRPVVVPPFGKVYNALAVAWWQYALSRPAASGPCATRPASIAQTGSQVPCSSS